MKIKDFLEHHGIGRNPFAEEEAQTDPVFKEHCIDSTYHPTWDKVFGDPKEPSTSIVFGEKGAGKTAMRLQIAKQIKQFNRENPKHKLAMVQYDDFNPYLDRIAARFSARKKPEKILSRVHLWDHMDAILTIGTTGLVDSLLNVDRKNEHVIVDTDTNAAMELTPHQARDLMLLAALYDSSTAETFRGRWHRLRQSVNYFRFTAFWDSAFVALWTLFYILVLVLLKKTGIVTHFDPLWLYLVIYLVGWTPKLWRIISGFWRARKIVKNVRVGRRAINPLRRILAWFAPEDLNGQPLPISEHTDDRYELLDKFMGILDALGYKGLLVVVDRVDEPHLVNGSAKRMKMLVWPLLDNKFLKQPNIGFKLMLPAELKPFIDREEPEFHQRARLDKQNLIPSFEWTGEALHDLTNARLQVCALENKKPQLRELIDSQVSDQRILEAMRALRVPRHLFKFLYRVVVAHCAAYTIDEPKWKVSSDMFESQLAIYLRDRESMNARVDL